MEGTLMLLRTTNTSVLGEWKKQTHLIVDGI